MRLALASQFLLPLLSTGIGRGQVRLNKGCVAGYDHLCGTALVLKRIALPGFLRGSDSFYLVGRVATPSQKAAATVFISASPTL